MAAYIEMTDDEIIDAYERRVKRLSESDQNKIVLRCLCASPKKNSWSVRDLVSILRDKKDRCLEYDACWFSQVCRSGKSRCDGNV